MKYYRHKKTGEVFAFAADGSDDEHIGKELVLMSESEVFDHLNPASLPMTREQIESARLRAYADPLIGSDRYFSEASREALLGNTEASEAAKQRGLDRFAEIQAGFPWPYVKHTA